MARQEVIMDLMLAGKLALVSGSTAGIGYAIAESLAREGTHVIINGRSASAVEAAISGIRKNCDTPLFGFAGDLSSAEAAAAVSKEHPGVEILINNLGIFEPKPFEDIPDEDWRRFFEVNVLSGVRLARLFLPGMKLRNWGRIIFVSSESGVQIPAEMIHYGVTKTALIGVARGLAEALAGTGITVNSVLPGPTRSRGVGDFIEVLAKSGQKSVDEVEKEFFRDVRPTSLIRRFATTEEVANMVVYLASPLSSATTGSPMRVDGGVIKSAF
jgi:NAD(P)-dependent dehydrogenase (short-subunit alcohol dehydrogenase family)